MIGYLRTDRNEHFNVMPSESVLVVTQETIWMQDNIRLINSSKLSARNQILIPI